MDAADIFLIIFAVAFILAAGALLGAIGMAHMEVYWGPDVQCKDCGATEDMYVVWHRISQISNEDGLSHYWLCDDCLQET